VFLVHDAKRSLSNQELNNIEFWFQLTTFYLPASFVFGAQLDSRRRKKSDPPITENCLKWSIERQKLCIYLST